MTKIGEITIFGRAQSQNDMNRLGVWRRAKLKKKIRFDAALLTISALPADKRVTLLANRVKRKVVVTCYRQRLLDCPDESLSAGSLKHIIDGMADGGAFVSDNTKWLEREYRQVRDRNERTTIEVYE